MFGGVEGDDIGGARSVWPQKLAIFADAFACS
jgi:hypothetical protein